VAEEKERAEALGRHVARAMEEGLSTEFELEKDIDTVRLRRKSDGALIWTFDRAEWERTQSLLTEDAMRRVLLGA
jgi:hypothetical protein